LTTDPNDQTTPSGASCVEDSLINGESGDPLILDMKNPGLRSADVPPSNGDQTLSILDTSKLHQVSSSFRVQTKMDSSKAENNDLLDSNKSKSRYGPRSHNGDMSASGVRMRRQMQNDGSGSDSKDTSHDYDKGTDQRSGLKSSKQWQFNLG